MSTNEPTLPGDLKRILTMRLDNIGDVVMTGPALRALRTSYPSAHIALMASPAGSQVGPLLPWVDEIITWRAVWQDIGKNVPVDTEKERTLVQLLKEHAFDAAFLFTSFSQSPHPPAYACYLAEIPIRVGQSKEFGGALLTHWVKPQPDSTHQVERNLHLLESVGLTLQGRQLELRVPLDARQSTNRRLEQMGIAAEDPYVALAPGASAQARRYDEQRFAQVAKLLAKRSARPVVLLGSPREIGKYPVLEQLACLPGSGVISLIGQTSVPEMAAVIERSSLVIANNSGAMHMAAVFQRPMVILFSGTELLEQWQPESAGARLLRRDTHCTPCHGFTCPYQMECLDIPAEEVAETAFGLLAPDVHSIPG